MVVSQCLVVCGVWNVRWCVAARASVGARSIAPVRIGRARYVRFGVELTPIVVHIARNGFWIAKVFP